MRYTTEMTLDLPRARVIELLEDPSGYAAWQPGLVAYEQTGGEFGRPGATARLVFEQDGRTFEMRERVVASDLPRSVERVYETGKVRNHEVNRFYEDGPERTRWVDESEFRFGGPLAIAAPFLGGTFRRETRRTMESFKAYAEGAGARDAARDRAE